MDNSNKSDIINQIQLRKYYINTHQLSRLLRCSQKSSINALRSSKCYIMFILLFKYCAFFIVNFSQCYIMLGIIQSYRIMYLQYLTKIKNNIFKIFDEN